MHQSAVSCNGAVDSATLTLPNESLRCRLHVDAGGMVAEGQANRRWFHRTADRIEHARANSDCKGTDGSRNRKLV
jgi:hypothetical protein